jgi:hypothetical protein
VVLDTDSLSLNIQFYDPKQLLDSVNKTVSVPYFNLCQIFLNKATELCIQHYKLNSTDICTVHKFDEKGASISIAAEKPDALACLTMISSVFQLLSEVLYKRYREEKRFVLQTRSAISSAVEEMQLNSVQAAERLVQQLVAKESALHVPNALLNKSRTTLSWSACQIRPMF